MRIVFSLLLYGLLLGVGAVRKHLPAAAARVAMRFELRLAIHLFWRGAGMDDAVLSYMRADADAYGPALVEQLFTCTPGSRQESMFWVPLIPFLSDKRLRARVQEYATNRAQPGFRAEIETTLNEAKNW